ncbi:MAG: C25 family cysteine peptidase, partial [Planctomycetota bacterium]
DYPGVFAYAEPVRTVRGQNCTVVWLYPYQYNPVTRRLSVYKNLVVELNFDGDIRPTTRRLQSAGFEKMLGHLAINADEVLPAQRRTATNAAVSSALLSIQSDIALDRIGNGQTVGCLVNWKRLTGFRTRYVTTEQTGSTAAEIESYIDRAQRQWFPAPAYVLLLGDAEYIPCFYELTHASDEGRTDALMQGKVASDRYYGDTNEDGIADVFVGRLPVDTAEEAQMAVNRIIDYERTPPDPATNPDFYANFAAIAYFDDYLPKDGYADTRFVQTSEDVFLYLNDAGYNGSRLYSHDAGVEPTHFSTGLVFENDGRGGRDLPDHLLAPSFEWNAGTPNITDAINSGAFLVTYRGHGSRFMRSAPRGWSYPGGWIHPEFQEHDVAALTNGSLAPVVFSATCMTGWFDNETDDSQYEMYSNGSIVRIYESEPDDESLCENFIVNSDGGAVGVIGATRVSYAGRNDRLVWGWMDAIWPDFIEYNNGAYGDSNPVYQMGPVFEYGKQYMLTKYSYEWDYTKTTVDEFVLFGDPTMEIRTAIPHRLTAADVRHPSAVDVDQLGDLTVSVQKGPDVLAGARVTISRAAAPDDYWTDLTDESGNATFIRFTTTQRGDYNIVVTAHNCIPYEGIIASETISSGALTIRRQVSASEDDGHASNQVSESLAADCLIVGGAGDHTAGMIFRNVNVPKAAEIVSAHLTLLPHEDHSGGIVDGTIQAEATDHAEPFSDSRRAGSGLRTSASVDWTMEETWPAGTWYDSPDISDVIAEVVNRDGWFANNSVAILLSPRQAGGYRCFSSYDRGHAEAPKLEITYAVDRTWIVSGRVTSDGAGLAGVRIEGFPDVVFTDDDGCYLVGVYYGWSGRVTPSQAGYVFTPQEASFSAATSDLTGNFEAAVRMYDISGHVLTSSGSGMKDVNVSASDGVDSTTTDSTGYYSLGVPHGWSGQVTASRPGYAFTVSDFDYAGVTSDRAGQDFVAWTRDISGYVLNSDGVPVADAEILAGDTIGPGLTDSAGFYSLAVPYGWSGRISLTRIGYVFDPEARDVANIVEDLNDQSYAAIPRTQTISGHVRAYDGSGISGVTVTADNGGGSDTTDSAGRYNLTVPYGWSGRVTPARGEYMFNPEYRDHANVIEDRANFNYARAQTNTISGYVRAADGSGIAGVTLSASDGGGSGVSNSIGFYRLTVRRGWSGRVTPFKPGYTFSPLHRDYSGVVRNRTNRNYSGQPTAGL